MRCERNGLSVPQFSQELQEKIRKLIRPTASPNNPIDLTFDMNFGLVYNDIPRLIWESKEVDAFLFYGVFGGSMMKRMLNFGNNEFAEMLPTTVMNNYLENHLKVFVEWIHNKKVPMLISCLDTADEAVIYLQSNNIPVFKWPSMATRAMKALTDYYCVNARGPN